MREAPLATLMNAIASARDPSLRSPYIQSVAVERHGKLGSTNIFTASLPRSHTTYARQARASRR